MAIDLSGQDILPTEGVVTIEIRNSHPLIQLSRALPWRMFVELVVKDLKNTTSKGCWWIGRKIKVRIHLGAYLLQRIYNLTDRKIEYQLRDNAAFQLFCGQGIVSDWHAPDHTKIEDFRSRLSPETHRQLANLTAQAAVSLGFADPREVDFDSTVQEANISYPSDASLMTKLAGLGKKFVDFIRDKLKFRPAKDIHIDMKAVKKRARDYFFLPKNKDIEIKQDFFKKLYKYAKHEMRPVVSLSEKLTERQIAKLPWNIKRAFDTLKNDAWRYLLDVGHFTRSHTIKAGKILSFHAKELACIKKGKLGKDKEFGRVFQLGRVGGNFMIVLKSTSVMMNDKKSFIPFLKEHQTIFGADVLESVATDKGYWTSKNKRALTDLTITAAGFAKPGRSKEDAIDLDLQERLHNRRAGIEPLIGHTKRGGQLGKSRMKSDAATLAAGYGSVLGFNLRQVIRHQQGKMETVA
jgi:IS5 family transposase